MEASAESMAVHLRIADMALADASGPAEAAEKLLASAFSVIATEHGSQAAIAHLRTKLEEIAGRVSDLRSADALKDALKRIADA